MMGPKKASEIKQELRHTLGKKGTELSAWLEQKLSELQPKKEADARMLEELLWVQEILRDTAAEKPRKRKARAKPT